MHCYLIYNNEYVLPLTVSEIGRIVVSLICNIKEAPESTLPVNMTAISLLSTETIEIEELELKNVKRNHFFKTVGYLQV